MVSFPWWSLGGSATGNVSLSPNSLNIRAGGRSGCPNSLWGSETPGNKREGEGLRQQRGGSECQVAGVTLLREKSLWQRYRAFTQRLPEVAAIGGKVSNEFTCQVFPFSQGSDTLPFWVAFLALQRFAGEVSLWDRSPHQAWGRLGCPLGLNNTHFSFNW